MEVVKKTKRESSVAHVPVGLQETLVVVTEGEEVHLVVDLARQTPVVDSPEREE